MTYSRFSSLFVMVFFGFYFLSLSTVSKGQAGYPAYHNLDTSRLSGNSFPLGGGANQVQYILGPGALKAGGTGTPPPRGAISAVYIKLHASFTSKATFSDFTIKLGQDVDTNTYWRSATWDSTLTTVFYQKSKTLTDTAHSWLKVPLHTKFNYDSSESLVFEFSVSSGTGYSTAMTRGANKVRQWGSQGSSKPSGYGVGQVVFGFDIIQAPPNDAGILELLSPRNFCLGKQGLDIDLVNNGSKALDSVRINWSINDTLQRPLYYKNKIGIQGSSGGNTQKVNLDSLWFSKTVTRKVKIWTSHPNGQADTLNDDDTLTTTLRSALNGKYTIGSTGADYSNFSSAAADLNNYGVCGPVHFKIAPGTYTDRLALIDVGGTSASHPIVFEGSGRTSTIIQNDATSTDDWQTILLYGSDYITIKNMRIIGLDSLWSAGVHFVKSNHNTIDSCDIFVPDNSYSIQLYGVVGSGTTQNGVATGISGDSNLISNLYIHGGYAGIRWTGNSNISPNQHTQFVNNRVDSFLRYGFYVFLLNDALIEGNHVESYRDPNAEGMMLDALTDFKVSRNYVRSVYHGIFLRFANYYGKSTRQSLLINNMVSTTGTFYAVFRNEYNRNVNVYHNSFSGPTFYCLTLLDVASFDLRNNIFENYDTGGNIVSMALTNFNATYPMDNNIYYIPRSKYTQVFDGVSSYKTVAAWLSASTGTNQHSVNKDPGFKSYSDLHISSYGRYSGDSVGVLVDYDGTSRCLYSPTIGAHEHLNAAKPDTSIVTPVCLGDTLAITLNPPKGLLASGYGKTWGLDSLKFQTKGGVKSSNYSIKSTTGQPVELLFYPDSSDVDSAYLLSFRVLNRSYTGCDSVTGHYIKVYGTPKADFTLDTNFVCQGHRSKLTNTSSIGTATVDYLWRMGDGFSYTKKSLDYTYSKTGSFLIQLSVSSPHCSDVASQSIYIGSGKGATLVPAASFTGRAHYGGPLTPDQACVGDILVYKVTPPTGYKNKDHDSLWKVSSISWNRTGTTPIDSLTILPDTTTDYTVQWLADSTMHGDTIQFVVEVASTLVPNCSRTLVRYVVVGEKPQPIIHHSAACLSTSPISFADSTKLPSGSWTSSWHFHDQTIVSSKQTTFQYADTGRYDVWLRVETNVGCKDSVLEKVQVVNPPKADFSISPVCLHDTSRFVDASTKADSYYWEFGDGKKDSSHVPKHVYGQSGSYDVSLRVISTSGCVDSITRKTEILDLPEPSFSVDSVCFPAVSQFVNASKADSSATFQWFFGGGNTSVLKDPQHQYAAIGDYPVTLVVTNGQGGCQDSVLGLAMVHPKPSLTFSIDDVKGTEKEFLPTQTSGLTFLWYFGDGDSSTIASPLHTYPSVKGDYKVKMLATNVHDCSLERNGTAKVWPNGLEYWEDLGISVYPNPFSERIIISPNGIKAPATLGLYNATGQLMMSATVNGEAPVELRTHALPSGVYLLKSSHSQFSYTLTLIKE